MNPVLAAIAVSAGEKIVNNAISYYTNKNSQKQAQANTRKNMQEQQALEDESWNNRIVNYTKALRDSGLSPALATGQAQGAASVTPTASPMPQVGNPGGDLTQMINTMQLNDSQKDLNEAAAEKAREEARSVKIRNDREDHVDSGVDVGLSTMLGEMRDSTDNPFMRGFLDTYLDSTGSRLNLGDYEAFNKVFYDLSQRERDRELDFVRKEFDKKVLSLQYENGAAAALADMPKVQRYQVYTAVHQMNADIARLNAETSLTEDQRDKLRAETSKLGQEVMKIFHSDPAAMYKAGDISALLVGLGYDAVKAGAAGAGFAAGTAVTRGKGLPNAVTAPSVVKKATEKGMPADVLKAIKASAAKHSGGSKVYQVQLENAAIKAWQEKHGNR